MRNSILTFFMVFFLFPGVGTAQKASDNPNADPLPVGSAMPDAQLLGQISLELLDSLGLDGEAPWLLSSIKAKTIIMVVYSMYCPYCQAEAPILNDLHALIKAKGLDQDIKIIGVAVGNSDFEVKVFREKYAVPYPLFSDPDFIINKALGEVRTPFFYVVNKDAQKGMLVAHTWLGQLDSIEDFLDQVVATSAP